MATLGMPTSSLGLWGSYTFRSMILPFPWACAWSLSTILWKQQSKQVCLFQIAFKFLSVRNGHINVRIGLRVVTWIHQFLPLTPSSIAICFALMVAAWIPDMILQLRLVVEPWQNTNPLNKGVGKTLIPLLTDSSWITQESSCSLLRSLIGPFVLQLMSSIQEELLNKGVKFFLTPFLTRSTRTTQQGS